MSDTKKKCEASKYEFQKYVTAAEIRKFLKELRALLAKVQSIDYKKSVLAHGFRAKMPNGAKGDAAFLEFCAVSANLQHNQGEELLNRAKLVALVPDERAYRDVGGYDALVRTVGMTPSAQRATIEQAIRECKTIVTLVREASGTSRPRVSPWADAKALAEYVVRTAGRRGLPADVAAIASRYLPSAGLVGATHLRAA